MVELLLGAGSRNHKQLSFPGKEDWTDLVTLDINPDHKPDIVWDLTNRPLPFEDNTFDEIHAYEVLEHLGQQGDWRAFFEEWSEWWRLIKPGGLLCATSPCWKSVWACGDPGHTRVISQECLTFLTQPEYTKQVGVTPMTDYRMVYKADFDLAYCNTTDDTISFGLIAVKPSRITKAG